MSLKNNSIVLIVIACLRLSVCSALADEVNFPTKKDTSWVYDVKMGKTSFTQTQKIVSSVSSSGSTNIEITKVINGTLVQTDTYLIDLKSVSRTSSNKNAISPPLIIVRNPIKIGDKWTSITRITVKSGQITGSDEVKVVGKELVKTPGGSFMAYRLNHISKSDGKNEHLDFRYSFWIAPKVGIIKWTRALRDPKDHAADLTGILSKFIP